MALPPLRKRTGTGSNFRSRRNRGTEPGSPRAFLVTRASQATRTVARTMVRRPSYSTASPQTVLCGRMADHVALAAVLVAVSHARWDVGLRSNYEHLPWRDAF